MSFNLENYIINCLKELGIIAYKKKNLIGIWTKDKNGNDAKIASLGLRVSKGNNLSWIINKYRLCLIIF